jgi:hypothetical protein
MHDIENMDDWEFAPRELLEREKVFRNQIAYHPGTASVALMLKRSQSGADFAMSVAGLDYLDKVRDNVEGPVDQTLVILMDPDPKAKGKLKIVEFHSADTMRARFAGKEPFKGEHGEYHWVSEQPKSKHWRLNEEAF